MIAPAARDAAHAGQVDADHVHGLREDERLRVVAAALLVTLAMGVVGPVAQGPQLAGVAGREDVLEPAQADVRDGVHEVGRRVHVVVDPRGVHAQPRVRGGRSGGPQARRGALGGAARGRLEAAPALRVQLGGLGAGLRRAHRARRVADDGGRRHRARCGRPAAPRWTGRAASPRGPSRRGRRCDSARRPMPAACDASDRRQAVVNVRSRSSTDGAHVDARDRLADLLRDRAVAGERVGVARRPVARADPHERELAGVHDPLAEDDRCRAACAWMVITSTDGDGRVRHGAAPLPRRTSAAIIAATAGPIVARIVRS